jgi:hypothetical protein
LDYLTCPIYPKELNRMTDQIETDASTGSIQIPIIQAAYNSRSSIDPLASDDGVVTPEHGVTQIIGSDLILVAAPGRTGAMSGAKPWTIAAVSADGDELAVLVHLDLGSVNANSMAQAMLTAERTAVRLFPDRLVVAAA